MLGVLVIPANTKGIADVTLQYTLKMVFTRNTIYVFYCIFVCAIEMEIGATQCAAWLGKYLPNAICSNSCR